MEVMPFLWATGGDLDAFHQALDDDPAVETATVAEATDGERLYRIVWSDEFEDVTIGRVFENFTALVTGTKGYNCELEA